MGREENPSIYDQFHRHLFTKDSDIQRRTSAELVANGGIFLLLPNFVGRAFCKPGKRIKLHQKETT